MFDLAKKELEKRSSKLKVVAGYISPSSDSYVSSKLLREAMKLESRLDMCSVACEDSDWIDVVNCYPNSISSFLNQQFISYIGAGQTVT